jgi:hypothetical protein
MWPKIVYRLHIWTHQLQELSVVEKERNLNYCKYIVRLIKEKVKFALEQAMKA